MWTREQLKTNGKASLRRFHWYGVLVCLITLLVGGTSGFHFQVNYNVEDYQNIQQWLSGTFGFGGWIGDWLYKASRATFLTTIAFLVGCAGLAVALLVGNVLEVGEKRFYLVGREQQPDFALLGFGFRYNYGSTVVTMLVRSLYIFLWSLLFVIPGIVKAYAYRLVPYLLAENPDLNYRRALELSEAMMNGHKGDAFVLDLSFIGWHILNSICGLVGILYGNPYIAATNAEFYTAMRAEAFAKGLTGPDELRGFAYSAQQ